MTDTGAVSIRGVPETILVAPDSFKGTFTAAAVADAIGRGLRDGGRPVDLCPLADGGEGTAQALREALGGELRHVTVHDPLGREIEAAFVLAGESAFVETAAASGLHLVAEDERDAFAAWNCTTLSTTSQPSASKSEHRCDVVWVSECPNG